VQSFAGVLVMAATHSIRCVIRHLAISFFVATCVPSLALAGNFFKDLGREAGSCLSGGCDVVWEVNKRLDRGISSKFESAAEPVKRAFEEAVHYLFDKELNPFLTRLDSLAEEKMRRIEGIFQDSLRLAEQATINTIERVRDEIIVKASEQLKALADEVLQDVKCGVNFTFQQAQNFMDVNFRLFGDLRDAVARIFDGCPAVDRGSFYSIYRGRKCQIDRQMENAKSVEELRQSYLLFLEFNSKSACAVLDRVHVLQEIRRDSDAYANRLDLWNLALK
jgi:hypothetical protein